MCELLVQIAPRTGTDIYQTTKLPQSGDVIVVMEDGHPWGTLEATNPDWRIIALPAIPPSDFDNLLTMEVAADPQHSSRTLQYRAMRIDLTKVPAQVKAILNARTAPVVTVPAAAVAVIKTAVIRRAPIADPAVIGGATTVIG